jgi:tetratricopeptide (TPR) repeat protein
VNRSFAVYKEKTVSPNRSLYEHFGVPRGRNVSLGDIVPLKQYSNPARQLNSIEHFERVQLKEQEPKSRQSQALLEKAKSEMKLGQFSDALRYFKQVLKHEASNPEALHSRALCFMHLNQHRMAIPDLLALSNDSPLFDKTVYLALAMCYIASRDQSTAVRHLSRGLAKFPKFVEGRVLRGQLYLQLQKPERALKDFERVLKLNSEEGSAYIGLGDTYQSLGDSAAAEGAYSSAIRLSKSSMQGLLKRGALYFEQGSYEKALEDVNLVSSKQFLSQNNSEPQASMLKGKVLLKQGLDQEAYLSFEQVLKYDEDLKYTEEALFHLTSIKIRQRDFYGAAHTLSRAETKTKDLLELEVYVEGVLDLMKRKFKDGTRLLSKVVKTHSVVLTQYQSAAYAYRGYGYACLDKLEAAVLDFNHVMKEGRLDKVTAYNRSICKGLQAAFTQQWPACLTHFSKAAGLFPKNFEPLFYRGVVLLSKSREMASVELVMAEVLKLVNCSISLRESESELYYARALLEYSKEHFEEAISDLDVAIDKSEDNVVNHFLCRGECYSLLGLYKEAMEDFSIVIQLDEGNSRGYLNRGSLAYLLEDTSLAFVDFQKLILSDPVRCRQDNPQVHIHAGHLLMLAGAFEDAAKAFSNANDLQITESACLSKAKCHLRLFELPSALEDLQKVLDLSPGSPYAFDIEVVTLLNNFLTAPDPSAYALTAVKDLTQLLSKDRLQGLTSERNLHWYKGLMFFYRQEYKKAGSVLARQEFQIALDVQRQGDEVELLFNISLCIAMQKDYASASTLATDLAAQIAGDEKGVVMVLAAVLERAQGNESRAVEMLEEAGELKPELTERLAAQKRLCLQVMEDSPLPEVRLDIPDVDVLVKPCFKLPVGELPSLEIKHTQEWLKEFTVKCRQFSLAKCKYEAPWLNRVNGSIQFTEQVQESSLVLSDSEAEDPPKQHRCRSQPTVKSQLFSDEETERVV